jgi:hypothetical protein
MRDNQLHHPSLARKEKKKKGGDAGIEPATSRTLSENHTPRPITLDKLLELYPSVCGLGVMIVACQVMDPGSNPGKRIYFFFFHFFYRYYFFGCNI